MTPSQKILLLNFAILTHKIGKAGSNLMEIKTYFAAKKVFSSLQIKINLTLAAKNIQLLFLPKGMQNQG